MTAPLKIAVCGATGRTGSRVAALASSDPRFHLMMRVDRARSAEFEDEVGACAAVIDFSVPEAAVRYAAACARSGAAFVTGTTGLNDVQRAQLAAAAKKIPVFAAANFSRGVAVMLRLAAEASHLSADFSAVIVETHHAGKKDAPSGTAARLAEAVRGSNGPEKAPTVHSVRLGDVVGDHELILAGPHERLTISHRAESRDVFARGALEAAVWAHKKKPGLYGMSDLLSLEKR